jgi:coenzyme F420-0:L-glutamate ligase/coenzyme F420-1:gamma-L-glutamate ligase
MSSFTVTPVTGLGEVTAGTDLAALLLSSVELLDGDVLVVTSKVVSKAEGRVVTGDREDALPGETDRVVARRGPTTIVRTHHGLVIAAAGIDASNTAPGTVVLLPVDPDGSARALRSRLHELAGVTVAVVVSDTSGRAWRTGQTDIAIGAAGLEVLDDHAGRTDPYGNSLVVTAPAVADELAAAGDLAKGKMAMAPVAVVRGLGDRVLPAGVDGPGAQALVRDEESDMFGLGARDAVLSAVAGWPDRGFGAPAEPQVVADAVRSVLGTPVEVTVLPGGVEVTLLHADPRALGRAEATAEAVATAHGWVVDPERPHRFRPRPSVDSPRAATEQREP